MTPEWYMGDLLTLAHDLADRLILAFDQTNSGLPHPRVHLIDGVPENGRLDTCTAGLFGLKHSMTSIRILSIFLLTVSIVIDSIMAKPYIQRKSLFH